MDLKRGLQDQLKQSYRIEQKWPLSSHAKSLITCDQSCVSISVLLSLLNERDKRTSTDETVKLLFGCSELTVENMTRLLFFKTSL